MRFLNFRPSAWGQMTLMQKRLLPYSSFGEKGKNYHELQMTFLRDAFHEKQNKNKNKKISKKRKTNTKCKTKQNKTKQNKTKQNQTKTKTKTKLN